ncbi:MAG: hypothetical protein FWE09_02065 [Treponema sp.]|nr:hypothetical protein [Treponema sp.]
MRKKSMSKKKFFLTWTAVWVATSVVGRILYEAINSRGVGEIHVWRIIVSSGLGSLIVGFFFTWIMWDWRKGEFALKGKTIHDDGSVTEDTESEMRPAP